MTGLVGTQSLFRTEAWVQAWLDSYGASKNIQLIDLGGSGHCLDYVYLSAERIKKIWPIKSLNLAGVSSAAISSPRAEYNNFTHLEQVAGGTDALARLLKPLKWDVARIKDFLEEPDLNSIQILSEAVGGVGHLQKKEASYFVAADSFSQYLASLGSNTRLTYFNRRTKLAQTGEIEFCDYPIAQAATFFELLNKFHVLRWGRPCYSMQSQRFLSNFMERIGAAGGKPVMQAMMVSGEVVSVLFDVVWSGRRYNFQSGYYENKYPKIALGALHFGYAIEAAINAGLYYDFMAGVGKNSNYKARIANQEIALFTLDIERAFVKYLRRLQGIL